MLALIKLLEIFYLILKIKKNSKTFLSFVFVLGLKVDKVYEKKIN